MTNKNLPQIRDFVPSDGVIDENFILKLFGLHRSSVQDISCVHRADGIHVAVTLARRTHRCPNCTCPTDRVKDYYDRKITHSIIHNVDCHIIYHARRYACPACGKTFVEDNPFVVGQSRVSVTTVYNVLTSLREPTNTFKYVAKTFNLSTTAVQSIFDRHVRIARKPLPEYILFDEVAAIRSDDSPYVFVMLDFVTQDIIDILPGRKKFSLESYFSLIPKEERANVRIVCSDLWHTYRMVARHCLPEARIAADEFHVVKEYSDIFRRIRIDVMNSCRRKKENCQKYLKTPNGSSYINPKWREFDEQYYLLKKFNWLLTKSDDETPRKPGQRRKSSRSILDPNRARKMNRKLGRYLNYYDIHDLIIKTSSDLAEAEYYYDRLRSFYRETTFDDAREKLTELTDEFASSSNALISGFAGTLRNWKQEIINSFIVVEATGTHISTSKLESKNKRIKDIKRISNGMTNFERLRNRIMYSLNENESFYLLPFTMEDN